MEKKNEIDDYIAGYPEKTREKLQQIRAIIQKAAPDATEVISYKMPAYKQNGILVYFGGHSNHIGFYPTGSGIAAFKDDLSPYKYSKGAIQFPLEKPFPEKLITKIVKYRLNEVLLKKTGKKK